MIQVLEPLSNSMLDAVNLIVKVQRSGDTDLISNITYSTIDSSAKSGQDFIYTSGIVTFHKGENSTIISVSILANHLSNVDSMFSLLLSMPSYPTTIRNNQVNVTITNRVLLGPYFSSVPQLDNVYHGTRHFSGGEYFDLPLACITVSEVVINSCSKSSLWFTFHSLVIWPLMLGMTMIGRSVRGRIFPTNLPFTPGRSQ